MSKEENIRTTVIIPKSDHDQLVAIAKDQHRSISSQSFHYIKKGLNADRVYNPED